MKNVLITGATGGIGEAVVTRLAASGEYNIIAHYHRKGDKKAGLLKEHYGCDILQADLLRHTECVDMVTRALKKHKTIDILINNAGGVYGAKEFQKLTEQDFEKTMNVNFKAVFFIAQKIFAAMKKKKAGGRIINISSISAKYGGGLTTLHYGCAKAALECFTKGLARHGAEYNILVNCIRLGFIDTGFHRKMNRSVKDIRTRVKKIPLQRAGTPDEVAEFIDYLCSVKSGFMTGEVITFSGGD